jgi:hypothetical protein
MTIKANRISISFTEKTPNYDGTYTETLQEYSPVWQFTQKGQPIGYLVQYENTYDAFYSGVHDFIDVNEFTEDIFCKTEYNGSEEWTKEEFQKLIDDHIQAYGNTVPPEILELVV